jgi:hypothetical protein
MRSRRDIRAIEDDGLRPICPRKELWNGADDSSGRARREVPEALPSALKTARIMAAIDFRSIYRQYFSPTANVTICGLAEAVEARRVSEACQLKGKRVFKVPLPPPE